MKPSHEGPSAVIPTREELQARVESLVKKKRSIKRKAQAPYESSLSIWGKILRPGASSPPSIAKERGPSDQVLTRGQVPPSMAAFICSFHRCFKLSINFISFMHMAIYMKSLARRASFAEGYARAVKAYKAKVASMTSEKATFELGCSTLPRIP